MHVSFDPIQRTSLNPPNLDVKRTTQGIANIPSSIESQIKANQLDGIYDWVKNIINQIYKFFSSFFNNSAAISSNSTDASNNTAHQIALAKYFLEFQFQRNCMVQADGQSSTIIVLMTYNNQHKVLIGTASQQRNSIENTKTVIEQFITQNAGISSQNLYPRIETILLDRNNSSFDHSFDGNYSSGSSRDLLNNFVNYLRTTNIPTAAQQNITSSPLVRNR